jgi:hypothetical protein
MVDWIFDWRLMMDEYLLWLVVAFLVLYVLAQNYALDGWELAVFAFAAFLVVMMLKIGGEHGGIAVP